MFRDDRIGHVIHDGGNRSEIGVDRFQIVIGQFQLDDSLYAGRPECVRL